MDGWSADSVNTIQKRSKLQKRFFITNNEVIIAKIQILFITRLKAAKFKKD